SVFGGNDKPVELLDVESGLWVAKAADRMHDPEVVDHLDGAISERADENVAAPSVQAEVIDTAKYTRQHDARAWDERHGAPSAEPARAHMRHAWKPTKNAPTRAAPMMTSEVARVGMACLVLVYSLPKGFSRPPHPPPSSTRFRQPPQLRTGVSRSGRIRSDTP